MTRVAIPSFGKIKKRFICTLLKDRRRILRMGKSVCLSTSLIHVSITCIWNKPWIIKCCTCVLSVLAVETCEREKKHERVRLLQSGFSAKSLKTLTHSHSTILITACAIHLHYWKSHKCRSIVAQNPGNVHWCAILFTANVFALLHNVCTLLLCEHQAGRGKAIDYIVCRCWCCGSRRFYCCCYFSYTSYPLHRIGFLQCVLKTVSRVSFRFRDRDSGF